MKSLSEPAFSMLTRRELLQKYFRSYPVPWLNPDDTLSVECGLDFSADKLIVTYTYDEVMHVLGEMKLRGLPYTAVDEVVAQRRAEIEAFKERMLQRAAAEADRMAGLRDDQLDAKAYKSKLFGAL